MPCPSSFCWVYFGFILPSQFSKLFILFFCIFKFQFSKWLFQDLMDLHLFIQIYCINSLFHFSHMMEHLFHLLDRWHAREQNMCCDCLWGSPTPCLEEAAQRHCWPPTLHTWYSVPLSYTSHSVAFIQYWLLDYWGRMLWNDSRIIHLLTVN